MRNETVGHGRSGHPLLCPIHALARRLLALRSQGATVTTPLKAVRNTAAAPWAYILSTTLTSRIRATLRLHPTLHIPSPMFP